MATETETHIVSKQTICILLECCLVQKANSGVKMSAPWTVDRLRVAVLLLRFGTQAAASKGKKAMEDVGG